MICLVACLVVLENISHFPNHTILYKSTPPGVWQEGANDNLESVKSYIVQKYTADNAQDPIKEHGDFLNTKYIHNILGKKHLMQAWYNPQTTDHEWKLWGRVKQKQS